MLQLLETQYYPDNSRIRVVFGNVQSRYRSLEWNQRYQPHAKRNRVLSKGCDYKDRSINVLSKDCEYKERIL